MRDEYIRQHYVPQHHLKQFGAGSSDKVWCFDKFNDKIFQVSPSNVALEKYFYDGPTQPAETEEWLTNLETEIAGKDGPYQKIIDNKEFSPDVLSAREIYLFAIYIAVQELRTRMWRDQIEDTVSQIDEFLGEKAPDDLKKQIREFQEEDSLRGFQTNFLKDHAVEAAELLTQRMKWQVIENKTSKEIWTSDNPVCRHNTRAYVENKQGGHGLLSVGVEVYFPLTPDLMLHLLDKKEYQDELLLMPDKMRDEQIITFFNDVQVQYSRRHIFSNTNDFKMAKKRVQETPEVANPDRDLSGVNKEVENPLHRELDESYFEQ